MSAPARKLPGPYELLDLADRQSVTLRIQSFEEGWMTINRKPPNPPGPVDVEVLRVMVAPGVKALPPPYYDITSKTLIAQLLPALRIGEYKKREYTITAYGVAPRKRFTVESRPL